MFRSNVDPGLRRGDADASLAPSARLPVRPPNPSGPTLAKSRFERLQRAMQSMAHGDVTLCE
jgi:hypothetical protein